MGKNIHVTHRKDGTWAVKGAGDAKASSVQPTQAKAIEKAVPLAEKNRADVVIHGRDNKIRDRDSYGNDPNPPKDRKH